MKLRRNRFVPTWRIKNSHLNILFFLGDYFIAGGGEYLELNQRKHRGLLSKSKVS